MKPKLREFFQVWNIFYLFFYVGCLIKLAENKEMKKVGTVTATGDVVCSSCSKVLPVAYQYALDQNKRF